MLDQITREDIEEYMDHVTYYSKDGKEFTNNERGKKRKLSALKSFYNYFFCAELIKTNPAALVPLPKMHEKEIIRLDADEVAMLLDQVEEGDQLTKGQMKYHSKTRLRDVALLTLLLGTGIRVSECVGLDIDDVDFKNNGIKIRRKGGYEAVIYFGDEVADALHDYLEKRCHMIPLEGHEKALFLSIQNRRITVRAVENLVKKYASNVTGLKKSRPISFGVPMVLPFTGKRETFILWQMCWDIRMSIPPVNIMPPLRMTEGAKLQMLYNYEKNTISDLMVFSAFICTIIGVLLFNENS